LDITFITEHLVELVALVNYRRFARVIPVIVSVQYPVVPDYVA